MKRVLFVSLPVLILAMSLVWASWMPTTLEEKVAAADVIIVGEIVRVRPKRFSITWHEDEETGVPGHSIFYDVGILKVDMVLKGAHPGLINKGDGDANSVGSIRVAFQSKDQDEHPFPHMILSHHVGEKGTWFLGRERAITGFYFSTSAENPLPETEIVKVKEIVGASD